MQTVGEETSDKIRTKIKSKISQVSPLNKKIKLKLKKVKVETDEDANETYVRGFNSVMSVFPNIRAS